MIKAVYKSTKELDRNFSIAYTVIEENGDYYLEAETEGGSFSEKACIGSCGDEKAERLAMLFAKEGVHPLHIEEIISDMRF